MILKVVMAIFLRKDIFLDSLYALNMYDALSVHFEMRVANFILKWHHLGHFCINFKNSCAKHQEEILRIDQKKL